MTTGKIKDQLIDFNRQYLKDLLAPLFKCVHKQIGLMPCSSATLATDSPSSFTLLNDEIARFELTNTPIKKGRNELLGSLRPTLQIVRDYRSAPPPYSACVARKRQPAGASLAISGSANNVISHSPIFHPNLKHPNGVF